MRLSIGEMAALNHVSVQTLRLYDKMGLLKPSYVEQASRYRYYSILQCAKLDLIQSMKLCGLSLKEILAYFEEEGDLAYLEAHLRQQKDWIREQEEALSCQKRAVCRTMEAIERYRAAPPDRTITLEYIPRRSIVRYDCGNNYFEDGLEVYKHSLLQLKHALADCNLSHLYYFNPGTIWPEAFVKERRFVSTEVFVMVDPKEASIAGVTELPAGMYQCIYCNGFEKERAYAELLLNQVEKNGYEIAGDYLCETIVETPLVHSDERGMFLRLQVPVLIKN